VKSQSPCAVVFVTRFDAGIAGGLGRYEQGLLGELRGLCVVEQRPIAPWPVPMPFLSMVGRAGWDLAAVLRENPSYVRGPRTAPVFHLSNQELATSLAWQRYQGATVVTVHDIIPLVERRQQGRGPRSDFPSWLLMSQWIRGLRRADMLIAISEWTRNDLINELQIPSERIRVVYQTVDHTLFRPDRAGDEAKLSELGVDRASRYLLYVGSLHRRKDVPTLVRALALARRELPDLELILAGTPRIDATASRLDDLHGEIDRLGLTRAVRSTGHISDQALAALYRSAFATVLPSRYEGFGAPMLEAMACGCPAIAAKATSLPEVVGDAGLLFCPGDAEELAAHIVRVGTDASLADRLSERGIERASQFTNRRRATETVAVYEEAVGHRGHESRLGNGP
jgi:glycosyltransferase involved in cell wall biosynthesis